MEPLLACFVGLALVLTFLTGHFFGWSSRDKQPSKDKAPVIRVDPFWEFIKEEQRHINEMQKKKIELIKLCPQCGKPLQESK